MTRASILWVLPVALLLSFDVVATRVDASRFFDQTLGDFSEELETARDEGKQGILLFFETEDCPFCARMKARILNRPEVQDFYHKHFLNFAVDAEGDVEIIDFQGNPARQEDFAKPFMSGRGATPVILFLDLQGRPVVKYTGATRTPEEFLWLADYMISGAYKEMRFTRYKRLKKKKLR